MAKEANGCYGSTRRCECADACVCALDCIPADPREYVSTRISTSCGTGAIHVICSIEHQWNGLIHPGSS